jgi:ketosteroid isomerase-like protein
MSQENVDVVRRVYGAGDLLQTTSSQLDRVFRDHLDEDFEFRLPADYPEGQPVFRGREGVDQLRAMLSETWREWHFEPERFLDAGSKVVVFARITGRGGSSGAPVELETTHVWTVKDGRAVSVHAYRDRAEALEAAGLSDSAMSQENADVVVAIADAVKRHDLDGLMALLDEEIEHRDAQRSTVLRGREEMRRHFVDLWAENPRASFSVDEMLESSDWVVVRQTWEGLAGGDLTTWVARQFLNRKVTRIDVCATRAEALEAAGLSE